MLFSTPVLIVLVPVIIQHFLSLYSQSKESGPAPLARIIVAVVSNVVWSLLDNRGIRMIGQSPAPVNNEQDEIIVKSIAQKIKLCDEDADGTI